jgi:hypothetical protein
MKTEEKARKTDLDSQLKKAQLDKGKTNNLMVAVTPAALQQQPAPQFTQAPATSTIWEPTTIPTHTETTAGVLVLQCGRPYEKHVPSSMAAGLARYEFLLTQPHLTIQRCSVANPAQLHMSLEVGETVLIWSNVILRPGLTFRINVLSSLMLISLLMALPLLIGRLVGNMQGLV